MNKVFQHLCVDSSFNIIRHVSREIFMENGLHTLNREQRSGFFMFLSKS